MAHLLSSAVSVASSKLRSNTDQDHHQPGLSPPLSPSAQTDIELLPQPLPTLPPRLKQPTSSTYDTTSAPFSPPYPNLDTTLSHTTSIQPPLQPPPPPPPRPSQEETDPLLLRSRLVEENEVRRRHSGKGRKIERDIKRFYQAQNEHIERLLKPMSKHASDQAQDKQSSALKVKIAIYGSILANFTLAGLQLYAAISSLSLSLFATAADSVFDPFANLVLNWLHSKSQNADERKWPIGGSRFESIGNISYAFLMGMVSAILIVQSIQELARNDSDKALHIPSLVAVGIAFLTKLSLAIYCYGLRKYSSQVEVLYQDHRNDLGINGFGIFTSAAGATIAGWIDPLGAMLISIVIIASWTRTCYHQFRELAGAAAPVEFLQLITYNSAIFSQEIQAIESVRAYSSGPRYIVEIDIVMHPETPLWKSHDLSQALQDSLEDLPMVERAFIHVDHEVEHAFEHRKLI